MTTKTYAQLGTLSSISGNFLVAAWDPAGPGPLKTAQASVFRAYFEANLGTAAFEAIGTSGSVVGKLDGANIFSADQTVTKANPRLTLNNTSGTASTLEVGADDGTVHIGATTSSPLRFFANGTEKARINADGTLCFGTTTAPHAMVAMANPSAASSVWTYGPDTGGVFVVYRNSDNVGVFLNYGANTWGSSSDERLKTDLQDITDALTKIEGVRTVTGRFLEDDANTRRVFFLAQDFQTALPEAVVQNGDYLGLQYTDVIVLLMAAVKELKAQVDALRAA